jgi:hypothetical protein
MRVLGPVLVLFAVVQVVGAILRTDDPEQWQTYETKYFSIELPYMPDPDSKTVTVKGETSVMEGYSLNVRGGKVAYIASSSNVLTPQQPEDTLLARIANELPAMNNAELLEQHKITIDGHAAVELVLAPKGRAMRTVIRACVANHRIYRVIAVMPEAELADPSHRRVLESFHILKP